MMRSIQANWDDYEKNCLPHTRPVMTDDERKHARAAFYTGAQVVLSILYTLPTSSPEARRAVIDGLQDEIYALVGREPPDRNAGHA